MIQLYQIQYASCVGQPQQHSTARAPQHVGKSWPSAQQSNVPDDHAVTPCSKNVFLLVSNARAMTCASGATTWGIAIAGATWPTAGRIIIFCWGWTGLAATTTPWTTAPWTTMGCTDMVSQIRLTGTGCPFDCMR